MNIPQNLADTEGLIANPKGVDDMRHNLAALRSSIAQAHIHDEIHHLTQTLLPAGQQDNPEAIGRDLRKQLAAEFLNAITKGMEPRPVENAETLRKENTDMLWGLTLDLIKATERTITIEDTQGLPIKNAAGQPSQLIFMENGSCVDEEGQILAKGDAKNLQLREQYQIEPQMQEALKPVRDELKKVIGEAIEISNTLKEQNQLATIDLEESKKKTNDFRERLSREEGQLESIQQAIETNADQLTKGQEELKETLTAYDRLEAETKGLKEAQLHLLDEISKLTLETTDLETKKSELIQVEELVSETQFQLTRGQEELKETLTTYDRLEAETKELKENQLHLLEEIGQLTAETTNLETKQGNLKEITKELDEKETQLSTTKELLEKNDAEFTSLSEKLEETNSHLLESQKELSQSQTAHDSLESEIKEKKEVQLQLLEDISQLTAEAAGLEAKTEELKEISAELENRKSELTYLEEKTAETQTKLTKGQKDLKETLTAYDRLENEIGEHKEVQLQLLEDISGLTAETADLETKKAKLTEISGELEEKQTALNSVTELIEKNNTNLTDLSSELEETNSVSGSSLAQCGAKPIKSFPSAPTPCKRITNLCGEAPLAGGCRGPLKSGRAI